jgi:hypothetical protein
MVASKPGCCVVCDVHDEDLGEVGREHETEPVEETDKEAQPDLQCDVAGSVSHREQVQQVNQPEH